MKGSINTVIATVATCLLVMWVVACSSVQDEPKAPAPAVAQETEPAKQEKPKSDQPAKQTAEKSSTKKKAVEVEGVISSVGQRTITFQVERKGKVREEVVGVDDKTNIEKSGNKVKLGDLQQTDKALINYEPEAYTPALAIKVIGKGEIQKVGGDD